MPEDERDPNLPFGDGGLFSLETEHSIRPERGRPTALVHILTPEFHGLDQADFADIPDEVVARATADELSSSLYWQYIRKGERLKPEISAFSYRTPEGDYVSVALTPAEYDTASESVVKLAQRIFNKVLAQRDKALQQETDDTSARARSDEDIRVAKRGSVRAVMDQQAGMEALLQESVLPKIDLIEKFIEMTRGHNPNLARGSRQAVSKRFDELRTTVFDDMLDAIALQRGWNGDMTERAKRIIQKRLYMSGQVRERIANFTEMLDLAHDYYGYKRALLLTKIEDAKRYQRAQADVVADIMAIDAERQRAKEAKQLRFDSPQ